MAIITCGLCRKTFEAGPEHCPHCHLRVPGAPSRLAPKRAAAPRPAPRRGSGIPRASSSGSERVAKPAGQCPACSHDITTADTWCKWCHWPVNR